MYEQRLQGKLPLHNNARPVRSERSYWDGEQHLAPKIKRKTKRGSQQTPKQNGDSKDMEVGLPVRHKEAKPNLIQTNTKSKPDIHTKGVVIGPIVDWGLESKKYDLNNLTNEDLKDILWMHT